MIMNISIFFSFFLRLPQSQKIKVYLFRTKINTPFFHLFNYQQQQQKNLNRIKIEISLSFSFTHQPLSKKNSPYLRYYLTHTHEDNKQYLFQCVLYTYIYIYIPSQETLQVSNLCLITPSTTTKINKLNNNKIL